ncbi:MAG: shikimate dehydrogenase [Bacteroidales bacterium]|nr:shikimate dehydrogenase [Bacteroidales bacterium]
MEITHLFGLVGKTLSHSFSQRYFTGKFEKEGLPSYAYRNFELDSAEQVRPLVERYPNLCGLNVTIPYKKEVIPLLDALSDEAAEAGAVNVIAISRTDGGIFLKGYNTDTIGFDGALQVCLDSRDACFPQAGPAARALVLGTGGAAAAVQYVLRKRGMEVQFVSRSDCADWTYQSLTAGAMADFQVVVNATPLGTWPATEAYAPIPYEGIRPGTVCFDLVYNPPETAFMKRCARQQAVVSSGLAMLHGQAEAAWRIWNNLV